MSRHDDGVRLRHMLDAAAQAVAFFSGCTLESFKDDAKLVLAITRLVEIIGEAAKSVSQETRARHPAIPWRSIAGTRDRLVHAYFDVDAERLWRIVSADLPPLIASLEEALRSDLGP